MAPSLRECHPLLQHVRTWGAVLDPLDPGAFWRQVALAIVHCGAQLVVVCASIACCRDWLHVSDDQRYDREDGTHALPALFVLTQRRHGHSPRRSSVRTSLCASTIPFAVRVTLCLRNSMGRRVGLRD